MTQVAEEIAHSPLGASSSSRWMGCAGSVAASANYPDQPSIFAAYGTAGHHLAENCLNDGSNARSHLGQVITAKGEEFSVDDEMADAVQVYLEYVRGITGALMVEVKVSYSRWVPDGFGTSDSIIFHGDQGYAIDLKMGTGVRVDAEENSQAMIYALGAHQDLGFIHSTKQWKLVIVQPRLDHISEWDISTDDLLDWADNTLRPAAELALSDNPPFNPSEKACQWCRAKLRCRARAEYAMKIAKMEFAA
jgi:hypothetical protein